MDWASKQGCNFKIINFTVRKYFSFNAKYYNYWPVYTTIGKYYPIGADHATWPAFRQEYPGTNTLNELITHAFEDNQFAAWDSFRQQVGKTLGKETFDYSNIHFPAYTAEVILNTFKYETVTHIQKLLFSVSFAGPFFTLFGIDETAVTVYNAEGPDGMISTVNTIVTSPCGDFATAFTTTEQLIHKRFSGYKLLPLSISGLYIKGHYNSFTEENENTVHASLFGNQLNDYGTGANYSGDEYYGWSEWRTEEPLPGGWTAYPHLSSAD
jgi:hypothetical protein